MQRDSMTTLCTRPIATIAAHRFPQAPHLMRHLSRLGAAKAENESLANLRSGVRCRKRPEPKAFLPGARRDLLVGHPGWKRHYQMHTGLRAQNLHFRAIDLGAKLLLQRLRQRVAAFGIQMPGLADMPREVPPADEVGQRRLI